MTLFWHHEVLSIINNDSKMKKYVYRLPKCEDLKYF